MTHITEAIGFVRAAADPESRSIEGIAIPYGVVSAPTEMTRGSGLTVREVWAPGSFARDAQRWAERGDGRKAPFRPRHGERPVGTVEFSDTPQGLAFRGSIFNGQRGDDYLNEVRSGLNAVSAEGMWDEPPRKMKDGTLLHRSGKIHGVAGSDQPAYDGAHIALRDMEDDVATTETTHPTPTPPPEPPRQPEPSQDIAQPPAIAQRDRMAAERQQIHDVGPKPDAITDLAFGLVRGARVYGTGTFDELGQHRSFFRDLYLATREGDGQAMERQSRHNLMLQDIAHKIVATGEPFERAGDVLSSEIPGAYPNLYLPGLLTPRILKGRPMANFINSFPVDNALPHIFAKVTTSTTATVQASQNTNPAASDFATTAVTATPLLYGASSLVARQVIDGASPAAEAMLLQDMYEAYGQVTEAAAVTAVEAGATASGTAITAATPWAGTLGNVIKYQATRFGQGAEGVFYPSALYTVLLSQGDTTGRPFMPMIGLMNSDGSVASGAVSGGILGAQVILSWGSTVNVVVTLKRNDYVIFESPVLNFRYEQATGPAAFNVGCWAYFVCAVRLGGLSVTAA